MQHPFFWQPKWSLLIHCIDVPALTPAVQLFLLFPVMLSASDDQQYQRIESEATLIDALILADIQRLAARYIGQNKKVFKMIPR
ncbi:hypothetical protein [Xenorhabdus vietnamensis]|uniref:hypothetical protein n=1 Tax=Xenorhabdus vietnamensis TaxID=351656 RepID=UPI00111C2118|nr:hypothetical protein [Xenorhabdus vietnamensis]